MEQLQGCIAESRDWQCPSLCFPLQYDSKISKHVFVSKLLFKNLINSEILNYYGNLGETVSPKKCV